MHSNAVGVEILIFIDHIYIIIRIEEYLKMILVICQTIENKYAYDLKLNDFFNHTKKVFTNMMNLTTFLICALDEI